MAQVRTLTGELSLRGALAGGETVAVDDDEEGEVLAEESDNTSDALLVSSFSLCNRFSRSCRSRSLISARRSATVFPCLQYHELLPRAVSRDNTHSWARLCSFSAYFSS